MGRCGENIRRRLDGRWESRVVKGRPVGGRTNYKYLYGRTYEDVLQKKNAFLLTLTVREVPAQGADTGTEGTAEGSSAPEEAGHEEIPGPFFEEVVQKWLAMKKSSVRESSYSYYAFMARGHILPELGKLKLPEITTERISEFLLGQKDHGSLNGARGLKDKTVADLKAILKQILSHAVALGLLERMPQCPSVTAKQPPISVLTQAEQERIEAVLRREDTPFCLGVLLSLYGGPRIGEVCGLKWKDFDFLNGTVKITKTISRIKNVDVPEGIENGLDVDKMDKVMEKNADKAVDKAGEKAAEKAREKATGENTGKIAGAGMGIGKGTKVVISAPKTDCSVRTIPLPAPVLEYLKARRGAEEAYVITGTEKYMEPRVCLARYKRLLARAGVAEHNYHCLRHTYATRCIENGVDVKSLSEIMGHSDVRITMQRYVHPSMDYKREQVNKLPCFQGEGQ